MDRSWAIFEELDKRCQNKLHNHGRQVGGRAPGAAIYPPELRAAICRGLSRQVKEDKSRGMYYYAVRDSDDMKLRLVDMPDELLKINRNT